MPKAKRLQGKVFCPITAERAKDWYIKGYLNTTAYLLIIKEILVPPEADLTINNISEFCKTWNIARATFYHATSVLASNNDWKWETEGRIKITSRDVVTGEYNAVSNKQASVSLLDTVSNELTKSVSLLDTESNTLDTRSPEPAPGIACEALKTISEVNKTLSEGAAENLNSETEDDRHKEREKKNCNQENKEAIANEYFIKYESQPKNEQRSPSLPTKEDRIISSVAKNAEEPRIKPKNQYGAGVGFGGRSTKKTKRVTIEREFTEQSDFRISKSISKLSKLGFSIEMMQDFQEYCQKRVATLTFEVDSLDNWVNTYFDSYLEGYKRQIEGCSAREKTVEQKKAENRNAVTRQELLKEAFKKEYYKYLSEEGLLFSPKNEKNFKENIWFVSEVRRQIVNG